jgi:hypothetical protein
MRRAFDETELEDELDELEFHFDDEDLERVFKAHQRAQAIESARLEKRTALEERAARELSWFFGVCGGQVPAYPSELGRSRATARRIAETLGHLQPFDRGALELMFMPRAWPAPIERSFGSFASLVVRLECAGHVPEEGATLECLEEAATKRLEGKIARRSGEVRRLIERAEAHEKRAIRAYITVRGHGRAHVPSDVAQDRAASSIGSLAEPERNGSLAERDGAGSLAEGERSDPGGRS